jgi:mono/diheme cytochrome c family protein
MKSRLPLNKLAADLDQRLLPPTVPDTSAPTRYVPCLSIPSLMGTRGLKRKLDATFEEPCQAAVKRQAVVVASRKENMSATQKTLNVCGETCGACLLLKVPNAGSHSHAECPTLSLEETTECKQMWALVTYAQPFNGACFKCHLPSGGGDLLHPDFTAKAPCPHPYLVWSMAYLVWKRPEYHSRAKQALGITEGWETQKEFLAWFVKGVKGSKKEPNGYRLMKWAVKTELGLV